MHITIPSVSLLVCLSVLMAFIVSCVWSVGFHVVIRFSLTVVNWCYSTCTNTLFVIIIYFCYDMFWRLMNALNTNSHSTTKFSLPANLTTYTVWCLFSPVSCRVQSICITRSLSIVTLARPSVSSSLQITNRSCRYAPAESAPFFIPSTSLCSLSSPVSHITYTVLEGT